MKVHHLLVSFFYIVTLISSLSLTKPLLVPYEYAPIELIDWILLPSLELRAMMLVSSVNFPQLVSSVS